MVSASSIRSHMAVFASDGSDVGRVDDVTGDHIKLTRKDSADGHHHLVPLSWVSRVEGNAVHLSRAPSEVLALGADAGGATAGAGTESPLPPIANPAIGDGVKRRNYYLPWILLALAVLLILLFLTRGCAKEPVADVTPASPPAQQTAALPVETVTLPNGNKVDLTPNTLNYELQRYLASTDAAPRTFSFDKLNFDTAKSDIRAEDQDTVNALGQILNAYPNAKGKLVGYADARGSGQGNAELGAARANAVLAALTAKGVTAGRFEAASGGEGNPTATNATAEGQFENRRTELVITAK